jgi:predicted transcriptional regulator of viral defense system
MRDEEAVALAAAQFNRVSRAQLLGLGITDRGIRHRLRAGRLVATEEGVYAFTPLLDDPWGRWMGATLTDEDTFIALVSACVAYGWLEREPPLVQVMRPGNGGPRPHGGVLVTRRPDLPGTVGSLRGVPITSPERTLLDVVPLLGRKALARALRQAVRREHTTLHALTDFLLAHPRRRGVRRLRRAVSLHAGLPLERARSGAEVRALLVLRDGAHEVPLLNHKVAGLEGDLVWVRHRLIAEIDGGPFHQDRGEDARREAEWGAAGWDVRRISSGDVYERPWRLLALVPETRLRGVSGRSSRSRPPGDE